MNSITEKQLNDYLTAREQRMNARMLGGSYFRGTVVSVIDAQVSSSTQVAGPFYVTIRRNGDTATDLTRYACSVPGYFPSPGDLVDLLWRSKDEAVVLQPVTFRPYRTRAINSTNQSIVNNAATKVSLQTVDYDPNAGWDATNFRYNVPHSGYYTMEYTCNYAPGGQTGQIYLWIKKNAVDVASSRVETALAINNDVDGISNSITILLLKGEYVELWTFWIGSVGNATLIGGNLDGAQLSVVYLGP